MWTPFIIHTHKKKLWGPHVTSPLCPSSSLSFSSSPISTSARDLDRWRPNPDSHGALLWHRLMGPVVLKVTTTANGGVGVSCGSSSYLRSYAHCSSDSPYSFSSRPLAVVAAPTLTGRAATAAPAPALSVVAAAPVFSHQLGIEVEAARQSRRRRRLPWSSRAPPPLLPSLSRCAAVVMVVGNEGPKPFEWGRGGLWLGQVWLDSRTAVRHDDSETKTLAAHGLRGGGLLLIRILVLICSWFPWPISHPLHLCANSSARGPRCRRWRFNSHPSVVVAATPALAPVSHPDI